MIQLRTDSSHITPDHMPKGAKVGVDPHLQLHTPPSGVWMATPACVVDCMMGKKTKRQYTEEQKAHKVEAPLS